MKGVEDVGREYLAWKQTERRHKRSQADLTSVSEAMPTKTDEIA